MQTDVAPLRDGEYLALQREYRMVCNRCLACGLSGHYVNSRVSKGYCKIARSGSTAVFSNSSSGAVSSVCPAPPVGVAAARAALLAARPAVSATKAAGQRAAAIDWDKLAVEWLEKNNCQDEWLKLRHALTALGESVNNANRYLQLGTDGMAKLWRLEPGNHAPKYNVDYKRSSKPHGKQQPLLVRKGFLKKVLMQRYRAKLNS